MIESVNGYDCKEAEIQSQTRRQKIDVKVKIGWPGRQKIFCNISKFIRLKGKIDLKIRILSFINVLQKLFRVTEEKFYILSLKDRITIEYLLLLKSHICMTAQRNCNEGAVKNLE